MQIETPDPAMVPLPVVASVAPGINLPPRASRRQRARAVFIALLHSKTFMAGAIIKMGQGGFMSLADKAITGFTSAGAAAGSAWAAGNVSMGQAGIDTHSVNTTSMHKMDYNLGLEGGGAAIGTSSGGVARLASNGSAALEAMHNRLMTSISTDNRLDSQRTQEAHETDIAGKGTAVSNRHSDASSYTDVVGHDNTRGRNQGHSTENAVSVQGSHGGSTDKGQGLHSGTRTASHFNTTAGASDNLAMGLGVGAGTLAQSAVEALPCLAVVAVPASIRRKKSASPTP